MGFTLIYSKILYRNGYQNSRMMKKMLIHTVSVMLLFGTTHGCSKQRKECCLTGCCRSEDERSIYERIAPQRLGGKPAQNSCAEKAGACLKDNCTVGCCVKATCCCALHHAAMTGL